MPSFSSVLPLGITKTNEDDVFFSALIFNFSPFSIPSTVSLTSPDSSADVIFLVFLLLATDSDTNIPQYRITINVSIEVV